MGSSLSFGIIGTIEIELIDTKGNITLIDFGSGSFIESLEDTEFEGTRIYSPPEWIQDQR